MWVLINPRVRELDIQSQGRDQGVRICANSEGGDVSVYALSVKGLEPPHLHKRSI